MLRNKCPAMTPEVLEALNEELRYIDTLADRDVHRADDKDHGVSGQLVTLGVYLRKAEDAWVKQAGDAEALDNLRKVAATAIRALVVYGCPRRHMHLNATLAAEAPPNVSVR